MRSSLVSLAGGMASLPITNATARATPLAPSQWRAMLRDAAPIRGGTVGRSRGARVTSAAGAADGSDAGSFSSPAAAPVADRAAAPPEQAVSAAPGLGESCRPGYSSRPLLRSDGAPTSTAGVSGYSWRSLGHGDLLNGATMGGSAGRSSRGGEAQPSDAEGPAAAPPTASGGVAAPRRGVIVLDVRNGYEWDAGHFVGAQRPAEVRTLSVGCFSS